MDKNNFEIGDLVLIQSQPKIYRGSYVGLIGSIIRIDECTNNILVSFRFDDGNHLSLNFDPDNLRKINNLKTLI